MEQNYVSIVVTSCIEYFFTKLEITLNAVLNTVDHYIDYLF